MSAAWIQRTCLSFPHVIDSVQWTDHLVFKVGGKMFATTTLEPVGNYCSFKSSPEAFAELVERPGLIPAPYLARASWVAVESEDALSRAELASLLRQGYDLVFAKLPKKTRLELSK